MQRENSFFDKYINHGIAPVNIILAGFICTQYGKKEDTTLFYFIIALSLLFDKGHIRVSIDEITSELEIAKLSAIDDIEKELYSLIAKEISDPIKIIKDNPSIFLPVEKLEKIENGNPQENDPQNRAPYLLLDEGKQIATEKLYFREKRFTDNFLNYLKSASKQKETKVLNKKDILSKVTSFEKSNNIALEEKQKEAVIKSFAEKYMIIAGGPGTGKTTVIKAIIETHLLIDPSLSGMIAVAAPTGKAARRLETVLGNLVVDGKVKKPKTMHTLLNLGYNERDPFSLLPYRMIIIDESSMLDLKMMQELMTMLHGNCSLIMVGDPQQLPAVGSGTLFSDITDDIENSSHMLNQHYVILERVKRSQGAILEFSENIRKGIFKKEDLKNDDNIKLLSPDFDIIYSYAKEKYKILLSCAKEGNPEKMLDALSSFVLLAPYNYGLLGVKNLNNKLASYFSDGKKYYFQGLPIIITKNDYDNGLYNGDRGVIIYEDSIYYAIFKNADEGIKKISSSILKEWEISYVQTVYKSQGNEYDSIAVAIATEADQIKAVTREVLYTAVTRAKKEIVIFGEENAIKEILKRKVTRNSGIKKVMLDLEK
ncbi:MAG: ATP-dependent RecD-like DNA helicase [Spirochaetaceae bacterium]|nr:ATP-dependent RecD-like DNA helicase [Spirochaetaceae bacterium]